MPEQDLDLPEEGVQVEGLRDQVVEAGRFNAIPWDGRNASGDDVSSGLYFAKVSAPGAPKKGAIKMVVLR